MLTNVRKSIAKVLIFILFGLLILSFAVWGIGDIFRGPGQATSVAEVGSITIEQQEFSRDLRQELTRLQTSFGGRLSMEQAQALGLVDQVLQQMVSRALFDQQAIDLGMAVTEEQIKDTIRNERAFQNQFGEFDPRRFDNVLRSLNLSEAGYIRMISREISRQQIAAALGAVALPPELLAERIFTYSEERRSAETILIESASFHDLGEPSEADLQALHEEFAAQFMTPETRSLTLIHLRAEDLAKEIAISDEALRAEFDTRRDDYRVAELRDIEQMLFDSREEAEAARSRIEQGEAFDAVARELTGSGPIGLGQLSRESLALQAQALADAAFALLEEGVTQPAESDFGWHLLRVTAITPGQEPVFEALKDEIRAGLAREQAVDGLVSIANELDDILAGGESLETAAAQLDLSLVKVGAIDGRGQDAQGQAIDGLPPLDEFLPVLAETAVGEESLLTETREGDYFVLRVDGVVPAEPRTLEAVRDDVAQLWRARSRERLAEEKAEALAARAKEGIALTKLAEEEGLSLVTRGPLNRFGQGEDAAGASSDLLSTLFELDEGAVDVASEQTGFLVVKLTGIDRPAPSDRPDSLSTIEERLAAELNDDLISGFSLALRQTYDVTVNGALIQEVVTRY